jgi:hypothetical protein
VHFEDIDIRMAAIDELKKQNAALQGISLPYSIFSTLRKIDGLINN